MSAAPVTIRVEPLLAPAKPQLWQVFIDVYCGYVEPPAWEENSPPKPLPWALDEAVEARRRGFPTRVEPAVGEP